jgi:hypothetical protein
MAQVVVNDNEVVNGKFTVGRRMDESKNLIIEGQFLTHRYFEDIVTLESDRYKIEDVEVFQESFGSDDFSIVYLFTAGRITVKGGESNLTYREIEAMESKLYGGGQ